MARARPTPLEFLKLFREFDARSWDAWRTILGRLTQATRELYVVAGRGSGKSRVISVIAGAYACRTYKRAPGENIYVGVFGPDRKQAGITFRYVRGLFRSRPDLAARIVKETRDRLDLKNGVIVEVLTANRAAPRGRSYAAAIVEEASLLPADETSADPDVEIVRAIRPALGRVPGSLLCVIGTPYRAHGVLYDAWQAGDADDRIVIAKDTLSLNPTFREAEIDRAFDRDPTAARSEYGHDGTIEFRSDISGLLAEEAVTAVTPSGIRERPPDGRQTHVALDAATGSGSDPAGCCGAFASPAELAFVRQWKPPFSPTQVVSEVVTLCAQYGVTEITIDRFAPGLISDLFRERGITCRIAEHDTSAAFIELLALINSKRVSLLDEPVLLHELRRLERRPGTGRDFVSHPPQGHDDVAAACAQALIAAGTAGRGGLTLPSTFTTCYREQSGQDASGCFLLGDGWADFGAGADGDRSCMACPGRQAAVAAFKAARASGTTSDIDTRQFYKSHYKPSVLAGRRAFELARYLGYL